jgi:catechol 2,3-dioxygenase-like lactoylglutathione lyase family enzyme
LAPLVRVSNAEASVAWYQRLGFISEFEHSRGPALDETTALVRRGELMLILSDQDKGAHAEGVIYLRVADVASIAAEFDVPPQSSPMIGPHLELHDPDGNTIRVVTDPRVTFAHRRRRFRRTSGTES